MYMSPEMLEGRPYNEKVELPAAASDLAALSRMSLHTPVHLAHTQHQCMLSAVARCQHPADGMWTGSSCHAWAAVACCTA